MSDTWISLLSGVVGAIVGGAASLAGTMVVNKRQMMTNARMRRIAMILTITISIMSGALPGRRLLARAE